MKCIWRNICRLTTESLVPIFTCVRNLLEFLRLLKLSNEVMVPFPGTYDMVLELFHLALSFTSSEVTSPPAIFSLYLQILQQFY
jgi:hypothetical protein